MGIACGSIVVQVPIASVLLHVQAGSNSAQAQQKCWDFSDVNFMVLMSWFYCSSGSHSKCLAIDLHVQAGSNRAQAGSNSAQAQQKCWDFSSVNFMVLMS